MSAFTIESAHAVRVEADPDDPIILLNQGDVVYYAQDPSVSATTNDGTLASGSQITLTIPTWIRSASSSLIRSSQPRHDASFRNLQGAFRIFDVQDPNYNAHADGVTSDHLALQATIDEASASGGGIALCSRTPGGSGYGLDPANRLILKSNVILMGQGWGSRLTRVGTYVKAGTNQRFIKTSGATANAQISGIHIDGASSGAALAATTLTGSHTLPVATINVPSTTGLPSAGRIIVGGTQVVAYTGKTGTTFTGCTGGTGTFPDGTAVTESSQSYTTAAIRYDQPGGGGLHTGVRIENCHVIDWPGPAVAVVDAQRPIIRGNHIESLRGGIVGWFNTSFALIQGNVAKASDDCIAAQAQDAADDNPTAAPSKWAIVGNIVEEQGALADDPDATNNGISVRGLQDSVISANTVRGGGGTATTGKAGINIDRSVGTATFYDSKRLLVTGNRILDPVYYGILIKSGSGTTSEITARGNHITGSGGDGIRVWASSATGALSGITIEGNDVIDCGSDGGANDLAGISLYAVSGGTHKAVTVSRNNVIRAKAQGINVQSTVAATGAAFDGNLVVDPNQGSNATTDGILLQGLDRFTVFGNRVLKTSGSALARYGINVASSTNGQGGNNFALDADFVTARTNGVPTPAWTAITYAGDFGDSGGSQQVGQYRYNPNTGYVELRGTFKKTTGGVAGDTITTLPTGLRPASTLMFAAPSGTANIRVDIASTGVMTIQSSLTAGNAVSFNHIRFEPT